MARRSPHRVDAEDGCAACLRADGDRLVEFGDVGRRGGGSALADARLPAVGGWPLPPIYWWGRAQPHLRRPARCAALANGRDSRVGNLCELLAYALLPGAVLVQLAGVQLASVSLAGVSALWAVGAQPPLLFIVVSRDGGAAVRRPRCWLDSRPVARWIWMAGVFLAAVMLGGGSPSWR